MKNSQKATHYISLCVLIIIITYFAMGQALSSWSFQRPSNDYYSKDQCVKSSRPITEMPLLSTKFSFNYIGTHETKSHVKFHRYQINHFDATTYVKDTWKDSTAK